MMSEHKTQELSSFNLERTLIKVELHVVVVVAKSLKHFLKVFDVLLMLNMGALLCCLWGLSLD